MKIPILRVDREVQNLRLPATFAALKHPNYRLWFAGQLVSLAGTWMQSTAQGFLVYELTRSPVFLGYVGFAAGFPSWLFSLYGGALADRMPRRTILIIAQAFMMTLALVLAALVFTGTVQPWHIIVLSFLLGIANAFDAPTRQAFAVELVERQDLANAIAINAMMFNTAGVFGPSIGALVYAWLGPAWCFALNGISFLAVIAALVFMRLAPFVRPDHRLSAVTQIKAGVQYVLSEKVVRVLIGNLSIVSIFAFGTVALLPAWAVKVLGGDVNTNGLLLSARGTGALIGALMVASLVGYRIKGKLWTLGSFALPGMLLLFGLASWLPASLILLLGFGLSQIILFNTSNALVQIRVPDELRGRVMSIFTLSFFGFQPIGSLLTGALATWFGERPTVLFNASALLVIAALTWLLFPAIRKLE